MAALLLLFLSVGALFLSSDANENYDVLPRNFKEGVDRAVARVNSRAGIQDHFLFFKGLLRSDIEDSDDVYYNFYHFYLKATNCSNNGTVDTTACQLSDDGALIDCAMCYKTIRGEIERNPKPYFKCVDKSALTERMKLRSVNHCNKMGSVTGSPGSLASLSPLTNY